jgi:hypothetical protein
MTIENKQPSQTRHLTLPKSEAGHLFPSLDCSQSSTTTPKKDFATDPLMFAVEDDPVEIIEDDEPRKVVTEPKPKIFNMAVGAYQWAKALFASTPKGPDNPTKEFKVLSEREVCWHSNIRRAKEFENLKASERIGNRAKRGGQFVTTGLFLGSTIVGVPFAVPLLIAGIALTATAAKSKNDLPPNMSDWQKPHLTNEFASGLFTPLTNTVQLGVYLATKLLSRKSES